MWNGGLSEPAQDTLAAALSSQNMFFGIGLDITVCLLASI